MIDKFSVYGRILSNLFVYTTWKKIIAECLLLSVLFASVFSYYVNPYLAIIASSSFLSSSIVYVWSLPSSNRNYEREVLIIRNYQKVVIAVSIVSTIILVNVFSMYNFGSSTYAWFICLFSGWYWFDKWSKGIRFFDARLNYVNNYSRLRDKWESASVAFERAESYRKRNRKYMAYKYYDKSQSIYNQISSNSDAQYSKKASKAYAKACGSYKDYCKNINDSKLRNKYSQESSDYLDKARQFLSKRVCSSCGGTYDSDSMYRSLDDMGFENGFYCSNCYSKNYGSSTTSSNYTKSSSSNKDDSDSSDSSESTQNSYNERVINCMDVLKINMDPNEIDEEIINKNYREMVKKHHPDVGGSQEKFKEIQEARDVLLDFVNA
jgi:hypothetical protein